MLSWTGKQTSSNFGSNMNVWIVTTGNSDVQLKTVEHWNDWDRDIKRSLYGLKFEPTRSQNDEGVPYRLPARVLGIAYDRLSEEVQPHLTLPLLENFVEKLKETETHLDQIVVLLTDQSEIFEEERQEKRCPFWQDTCELYPILERYFCQQFPEAEVMPLLLKPNEQDQGLDDWDAVLALVRGTFDCLDIEPTMVYVSHQAGTPAISSAVQFASLAKFGDRVKFLVSNEYRPEQTRAIESSRYLSAIRLQEAKALLDRYDYSGVKELYGVYLSSEANALLNAAIQWNFAKFDQFADALKQHPNQHLKRLAEDRTQSGNWWWTAYEAAWLAVVRLEQGNAVEAMFHSFRAFEGLAIEYIKGGYGRKVFKQLKHRKQAQWNNHPYLSELVDLVETEHTMRNDVLDRRNNLFHRLCGLTNQDLYDAWKANEENWQSRLLGCLDFISEQEKFKSLEEASLMVVVHQNIAELLDRFE